MEEQNSKYIVLKRAVIRDGASGAVRSTTRRIEVEVHPEPVKESVTLLGQKKKKKTDAFLGLRIKLKFDLFFRIALSWKHNTINQ